jgi:competence protein ComEC
MPLFWLSLSFLAGILVAAVSRLSELAWLSLGGGVLLLWLGSLYLSRIGNRSKATLSFPFYKRISTRVRSALDRFKSFSLPIPLPLLFMFMALGAARYQLSVPNLADPGLVSRYNDLPTIYTVEGVLVEPPDARDTYTNLLVQVDALQAVGETAAQPIHGQILAKIAFQGDWRYGDRLRLQGGLVTPPESEGFSYKDYLYRQQIYSIMQWPQVEVLQRDVGNPVWSALYQFKGRALDTLYRLYPDPEASLLAGIVVGVETGIPQAVTRAFQDTGTAHIIAISGFNIPLTQTALL